MLFLHTDWTREVLAAEVDFLALQGYITCVKAKNASWLLCRWMLQQLCRQHDWCASWSLTSCSTWLLGSACRKGGAVRVPAGTWCPGRKWEAWQGLGKNQRLPCIRSVLSSPYIAQFLCTGNDLWVFHLQVLLACIHCLLPSQGGETAAGSVLTCFLSSRSARAALPRCCSSSVVCF